MNKHWKAHSFVVGSLLLIAPGIMVAREPKLQNPCKDLRLDLDSQVNSLHKRQDDELAQCRQTNGKNAAVCSELKAQQQLALRQLRDQRQSELSRCNPRLNGSSIHSGRTDSCDNAAYQDNDLYPHKKHPELPYPPTTNPPNAQNPPPKHDGGGNGRRGDPDVGPTRNVGGSGSQHGSDHSSGSSSSSSGGGSGSSSHSGSPSGSSSSTGSGSAGSSSSSNSSSSSSNSSSNSSNNSSSGSSNSPPASSAPAPSSAPSHSSGGRPPQ